MEEELGKSHHILDTVFRNIPQIMTITDPRGRFLKVNEAWNRAFGIEEREIVGKYAKDVWPRPEKEVREMLKEARAAGNSKEGFAVFEAGRTTKNVVTAPGGGATFEVYLEAMAGEVEQVAPRAENNWSGGGKSPTNESPPRGGWAVAKGAPFFRESGIKTGLTGDAASPKHNGAKRGQTRSRQGFGRPAGSRRIAS